MEGIKNALLYILKGDSNKKTDVSRIDAQTNQYLGTETIDKNPNVLQRIKEVLQGQKVHGGSTPEIYNVKAPIIPSPTPTAIPTPSPSPVPKSGLNSIVQQILEQQLLPSIKETGVHPAVSAGMFGMEGRNTGYGFKRNNPYNLAYNDSIAATGSPKDSPDYPSLEYGAKRFGQFVSGIGEDSMYANGVDGSKTGKIGKKQLQEIFKKYSKNPREFIKAIAPMYSSNSDYANNVFDTPEFKTYEYTN